MAALAQSTSSSKQDVTVKTRSIRIRDLRDISHPDSLFKNSITREYFLIHPDWNSELLIQNKREPLKRPAWAWEQCRHNPNVQFPFTYLRPSYGEQAPVQRQHIPYRLQIGAHQAVTPTTSQGEVTHMPQTHRDYYMKKAAGPSDTQSECFTVNEPEDFQRLSTTMKQRERLQFHLHY